MLGLQSAYNGSIESMLSFYFSMLPLIYSFFMEYEHNSLGPDGKIIIRNLSILPRKIFRVFTRGDLRNSEKGNGKCFQS